MRINAQNNHGLRARFAMRSGCAWAAVLLALGWSSAVRSADLSVGSLTIQPGATDQLIVSGDIAGESTFGVTILVEIVSRAGNVGMVTFTPATGPGDVDVVQVGDAWPAIGTFDPFDTDPPPDGTDSLLLNGSVDDNGTFLFELVTFSGPLSSFPIVASSDADGVWDVLLSTSSGDSSWQDLTTTLVAGTITVQSGDCPAGCDDLVACTDDACVSGTCQFTPNNANCVDDGAFCTGTPVCDAVIGCVQSGDPCPPDQFCNESTDSCDECSQDADCDDGVPCTNNACADGSCAFTPNDANCPDDGMFCNGVPVCNASLGCVTSGDPCAPAETCNEDANRCDECQVVADCSDGVSCTNDACVDGRCVFTANDNNCADDGVYCNGETVCDLFLDCVAAGDPCGVGSFCNETTSSCDECQIDSDCSDGVMCTDDTCVGGSCSFTANDANCADDGVFCNGPESCDAALGCVSSGDPCEPRVCLESSAVCTDCITAPACDDGNACTDDVCNGGACEHSNLIGTCDDSDPCTVADTCSMGECAGTPLDCSSLDTDCMVGTCDPATGLCEALSANDGGACDDGDLCTSGDLCDGGVCSGTAVDCSPLNNTCNLGTCDPGTGSCGLTPTNDGGACDDANPCTIGDVCTDGVCGGAPVDCSSLDGACNVGTCNITTGACEAIAANDNAACNDGSFCTAVDVCLGGVCIGSGDPCTGTVCDETNNQCVPVIAMLSVQDVAVARGTISNVPVRGRIAGFDTFGVGVFLELIPRVGNTGQLVFTTAPPSDITQGNDAWPGIGTFSVFDTDATGSSLLNGAVDDNGTFTVDPVVFDGVVARFPVAATADAGGIWDLTLSTSAGDSGWEGVATTLVAGTVTVQAAVGIAVGSFAMPPASTVDLVVSGTIEGQSAFGVTILCELLPRAGAVGTLIFTPAAPPGTPVDIRELGDPWPLGGAFTPFDTDQSGLLTLNGSVTDNGTFVEDPVVFSGLLTALPVVASADADGVWDVTLTTSVGASAWDNLAGPATVPFDATITVSAGACALDADCDDANVCTVDSCNAGVCEHANVSGSCDDADACTVGDFCLDGACRSGSVVDCSGAGGQCNTASCDPGGTEGNCALLSAVADGTDCDDGDSCLTGETCQAGVCGGSLSVDCSSVGDQCNTALCDPLGAEGNCALVIPLANGTLCDDADRCQIGESCQAGVCTGSVAVDCAGVVGQCQSASCDPGGGEGNCDIVTLAADGTACDDGDACMIDEACLSGACASGSPVNCTDAGPPCTTAACDGAGAEGNCDLLSVSPDGSACDDGAFCTATDQCNGGVCVGSGDACPGLVCDDAFDACVDCLVSADCDDSNVCTNDTCLVRTCIHSNNIAFCDDGNPCTLTDRCSNGLCNGTGIINCSNFSDQCNTASCDSGGSSSNCDVLTPVANGTLCDDADACTLTDTCSGGVCAGTPLDCSTLDSTCTMGTCDPEVGLCRMSPANEGGACDDGFSCTLNDVCTSGECSGMLSSPAAVDLVLSPASQTVSVGQTFRIDLIASSATCLDQPLGGMDLIVNWDPAVAALTGRIRPVPNLWLSSGFPDDSGLDGLNAPFTGTPANDGDAFYQALHDFQAGVMIPPSGIVIVTLEFTALDGALDSPLVIAPSAGSFTSTRFLGAGADVGLDLTGTVGSASVTIAECSLDIDCDNGDVCTTDRCVSGICEFTNNAGSCDDGQFCTTADACAGGVCTGGGDPCSGPLLCSEALDACVECVLDADCDDANGCTDDICNAAGACENLDNTAACDDGVFCTSADVCGGGGCLGGASPCTSPSLCSESLGACVECLANGDCDDINECTVDACEPDGSCSHTPQTGTSCDDGLFCTATDTCVLGVCVGSNDPCEAPLSCSEGLDDCVICSSSADCDDGNPCTDDICDGAGACQNVSNTLGCDDGLFCTAGDTCLNGTCLGTADACPGRLCDEGNSQCVDCFTLGDCVDDGIACTVDACTDGACVYTPDDTACDDGLFCNGAEFCSPLVGCTTSGSPCDDIDLCDETDDSCGCQQPLATDEGSRFISVQPRPGSTPVALVLTGVDAEVSCLSLYIQPDGRLRTTPVFLLPEEWGTVHVFGSEVQPSTTYAIQAECETGQGLDRSTPAVATTWIWGDTDNSGGLVDIFDAVRIIDGFRNLFLGTTLYNVELWGPGPFDCRPDLTVNIIDITLDLDAFRQLPFPCAAPCE